MSDIDRHEKPRERPPWHLPEQAVAYLVSVGFLTLAGPFETYEMAWPVRLGYWALCMAVGWAVVFALIEGSRHIPRLRDWPRMRRVVLALVLAAPLITLGVWGITLAFGRGESPTPPWVLLVNVSALSALVGGVLLSRIRPRLEPPAPLPERNVFLDKLPPKLGTALISLTAQDHYVEVTTAKGSDLLHMRLGDAIEMLGDYPGQQIHRSHWISGHAFTGLGREDGRLVAHLINGRALPVSRSFTAAVRKMQPVRPIETP